MTIALVNECKWYAAQAGLGDFVVSAAYRSSYTPEACTTPSVIDGETYVYVAVYEAAGGPFQRESGRGAYRAETNTLERTEIIQSSNNGEKVSFAGPAVVSLTIEAQTFLDLDAAAAVVAGMVAGPPNTGDVPTWDGTNYTPQAPSAGSLALDDLTDVDTSGGVEGDVLTQQMDGSFAMETPTGGGGGGGSENITTGGDPVAADLSKDESIITTGGTEDDEVIQFDMDGSATIGTRHYFTVDDFTENADRVRFEAQGYTSDFALAPETKNAVLEKFYNGWMLVDGSVLFDDAPRPKQFFQLDSLGAASFGGTEPEDVNTGADPTITAGKIQTIGIESGGGAGEIDLTITIPVGAFARVYFRYRVDPADSVKFLNTFDYNGSPPASVIFTDDGQDVAQQEMIVQRVLGDVYRIVDVTSGVVTP